MQVLTHHPDGTVYLHHGHKRYFDSAVAFAADAAAAGLPDPLALREGFWTYAAGIGPGCETIGPDGRHGPRDGTRWPAAEAVIYGIDALLGAQAARQAG